MLYLQTPILWSHGIADGTVLFEAGQAGPPFLDKAGFSCEFKVKRLMIKFSASFHLTILFAMMQAYPGLGHSINNEELKHLESWIKARLRTSS